MKTSRILTLVAAVVALLAVVVGGAVALSSDDSPVAPSERGAVAPATANSALSTRVSALNGTPVALKGSADYVELAQAGANLTAARVAQRPATDRTVYLVPARDGACLTSEPLREGGCFDAATLSTTVTAASILCSPQLKVDTIEIYGTAPDEIDSVTVTREDGSAETVPVRGNTYVFTTDRDGPRPLTIDWTANGKTQSISAQVPADYRDDRCATPAELQQAQHNDDGATGTPTTRSAADAAKDLAARR